MRRLLVTDDEGTDPTMGGTWSPVDVWQGGVLLLVAPSKEVTMEKELGEFQVMKKAMKFAH
jgi:hypothetical protein